MKYVIDRNEMKVKEADCKKKFLQPASNGLYGKFICRGELYLNGERLLTSDIMSEESDIELYLETGTTKKGKRGVMVFTDHDEAEQVCAYIAHQVWLYTCVYG